MKKRVISILLTVVMLFGILPALPLFADEKPTLYILDDVYGAPGETVTVRIGFKNMGGKQIRQLEACLDAGGATVVASTSPQLTPAAPGVYGYVSSTNGRFAVSTTSSFSSESVLNVEVKIPDNAAEGDSYALNIGKFELYPSVLQWADETSPNGDVIFEGATLHVTRFTPVSVAVKDTVAYVDNDVIRVPVVMSATNAKLASCTALNFTIGGSAAGKVKIDNYASKEFAIKGANSKYTVMQPESDAPFALGYSAGYENAVVPKSDDFQIFELVLKVTKPLSAGDTLTISLDAKAEAFKVYGQSQTDLVQLHVTDLVSGTVYVEMPYEWEVVSESAATARLTKYVGTATVVELPATLVGDGKTGTKGKTYTVVELYGNEDEGGLFCDNEDVISVTIPEGVKKVYEYAFFGCLSLEKLIVKSTDMQIVEEYGQTFLHYQSGRNYKLLPNVVIESYESATVRAWAKDNGATFKNLIAFAGVQLGTGELRFVGAMEDLEYQCVRLEIKVNGKIYNDAVNTVFTTLQGTVNGTKRPVATTDASVHAEYSQAHYIEAYSYLFGYQLSVEGDATFTVTPKATTAAGVEVSGASVTVTYSGGQISYS